MSATPDTPSSLPKVHMPPLDPGSIERALRAAITQAPGTAIGPPPEPPATAEMLPRFPSPATFDVAAKRYRLSDFLVFQDRDFVGLAYRGLLKREPEGEGFAYHLEQLRSGRLSRIDILGDMAQTAEAQQAGVEIEGLRAAYRRARLARLPLLGRFVRWLGALAQLPGLLVYIRQVETAAHGRMAALTDALEAELHAAKQAQAALSSELAGKSIELAALREETRRALEALQLADREAAKLSAQLQEHATITSRSLLEQERRIARLIDAALGAAKADAGTLSPAPTAQAIGAEKAHLLDSVYVALEERFRGAPAEIERRLSAYLPAVRRAIEATGTVRALDIGCGRGEWLRLLSEQRWQPVGIDLNRIMVEENRVAGRDVREADFRAFLAAQPEGTYAAVSAFHLVEHLVFEDLVALFDGARHVLAPGGVLICETPNPRNVPMATNNFYIDPTHRNPVPAELLRFVAEVRGFVDVEIVPSNPFPQWRPQQDDPQLAAFNDYFFGPQDYALIARKPNI
jgi:O-antigen chain-terminating methyltransferase